MGDLSYYLMINKTMRANEAHEFCTNAGGKLWEPISRIQTMGVPSSFESLYQMFQMDGSFWIWTGIHSGKWKTQ